eukprot:gene7484-biopygen7443
MESSVAKQPRLAGPVFGFKRGNRIAVLQGQADVVQAIDQAVLAEGVHFKVIHLAVRTGHGLRRQVDGQLVAHIGFHLLEQLIHFGIAQDDRQQAVLEAVVEEDVGVARRDDAAKAIFFQGPRRVLTAGAATEVFPGQQYTGALVTLGVEHKVLVQRALGVVLVGVAYVQVAPLVEQVRAKTGALDRFQELLGNDLVGVHVGTVQRRD